MYDSAAPTKLDRRHETIEALEVFYFDTFNDHVDRFFQIADALEFLAVSLTSMSNLTNSMKSSFSTL